MPQPTKARVSVSRCPVCGAVIGSSAEAARYRPFCSRRCADQDLHQWLGEGYRIAGEPVGAIGDARDAAED